MFHLQPSLPPLIGLPIWRKGLVAGTLLGRSNAGPSFAERMSDSLDNLARTENEAAQLVRDYETGKETDLTKVMVAQQVSSLSFQMTLSVRNKALSAYKDIMNMPI